MSNRFFNKQTINRGFTLVEMLVVAPIVILFIGAFITVIVNLTGETLASQASNNLAYNVQDALNRIEEDAQFSTAFLAINDIPSSSTKQGYNDLADTGSTTDFTNVIVSGGSPASLIIERTATNTSQNGLVFLANSPNSCADPNVYSGNTPMSLNVVYFIDANNVLWRRTIMATNFDNPSIRCGAAPLQQPTCGLGYNAALRTNCKTNDVKLVTGVTQASFNFSYYASASAATANASAVDGALSTSSRDSVLTTLNTIEVTLSATNNVAGRTVTQSGTVRATRL